MRALSLRQANSCENAAHPKCRCRCGGLLHGGARASAGDDGADRSFFEVLPEDDPHHVPEKPVKIKRHVMRIIGRGLLGLGLLILFFSPAWLPGIVEAVIR